MKTTNSPPSSLRSLTGHLLVALGAVLATANSAHATSLLLNNGLAPPNAANVIDGAALNGVVDNLIVHDEGCALSPYGSVCANPGSPTTLAITTGGVVVNTSVYGNSHIDMLGGDVFGAFLAAAESASILMSGGTVHGILESVHDSEMSLIGGFVGLQVRAWDRGQITIAGGTIGTSGAYPQIRSFGQAVIDILGHDFAIDGVAVPLGEISALTGRITGTLASGDLLDYRFERVTTSAIRLIANPEPGTGLLLGFGLIALGARWRRRA